MALFVSVHPSNTMALNECEHLNVANFYFGGQCIDELARHFHTQQMAEMQGVWERWHLNDLHAGCEHQRDFEKEPYEKHALEVCPVCGHKYGSDWQREELPQEVIDMIKSW